MRNMKRLLFLLFIIALVFPMKAGVGTHWTFNDHMACSLNATIELFVNGESIRHEDYTQYYELGAFVDDECRSSYLPDETPELFGGGYLYQMTIYSEVTQGEEIYFRLFDHLSGQELDVTSSTTIVFIENYSYGDALEPYAIYLTIESVPTYYSILAYANPEEGGGINGAGSYEEGATCTLTATAKDGYSFDNWTKNGTIVSTESVYSFIVYESEEYVANFSLNSYIISASAYPALGGIITGTGTYNYGETATLIITPNTNYTFRNWTENGTIVSENETFSFVVTDNRSLTANLNYYDNIEDISSNSLVVYPNPSSGKFFIESEFVINQIEIYDLSGKLLYHISAHSDKIEIDISNFLSGIYTINFLSSDYSYKKKLFVIH